MATDKQKEKGKNTKPKAKKKGKQIKPKVKGKKKGKKAKSKATPDKDQVQKDQPKIKWPKCECGQQMGHDNERRRTEITQWFWCPHCNTMFPIPIMFL